MKKSTFFALSFLLLVLNLNSQVSFTINPTICKNDTAQLTAFTGTIINCTYTWTSIPSGANFSTPNNSVTSISFSNSINYTISLSVSSGTFSSTYQASTTVLPLPNITLTQNAFTTCVTSNFPKYSKPVHLMAGGGISYYWNPPFSSMIGNQNGPGQDARPAVNSCFSVTGIDANGCKAMASICITVTHQFTITVSPTNTFICKVIDVDEFVKLTAFNPTPPSLGLPSTHNYSWTACGIGGVLTSPFSASVAVSPSSTCTFTAEMLDSVNCISLPAHATVIVHNCNGFYELNSSDLDFTIFPNPVHDLLNIRSLKVSQHETSLSIVNNLGETIYKDDHFNFTRSIDLTYLSSGIYFLKLDQKTIKFIKQ
jgi:hypothetical protein